MIDGAGGSAEPADPVNPFGRRAVSDRRRAPKLFFILPLTPAPQVLNI